MIFKHGQEILDCLLVWLKGNATVRRTDLLWVVLQKLMYETDKVSLSKRNILFNSKIGYIFYIFLHLSKRMSFLQVIIISASTILVRSLFLIIKIIILFIQKILFTFFYLHFTINNIMCHVIPITTWHIILFIIKYNQ